MRRGLGKARHFCSQIVQMAYSQWQVSFLSTDHVKGEKFCSTDLTMPIIFQHKWDIFEMFIDKLLVVAIQRQTDCRVCWVLSINHAAQWLQQIQHIHHHYNYIITRNVHVPDCQWQGAMHKLHNAKMVIFWPSQVKSSQVAFNIWQLQMHNLTIQESLAIAKTTARCAQYMGALKSFESPRKRPRLLFPKFVKGFGSDRY